MRKLRSDFNEILARSLYLAHESGLSYNDIVRNPNYNIKQLSHQRIQQLVSTYKRYLEEGKVTL